MYSLSDEEKEIVSNINKLSGISISDVDSVFFHMALQMTFDVVGHEDTHFPYIGSLGFDLKKRKYYYDNEKAIEWCKKNKPSLVKETLDRDKFEKLCETEKIDFVKTKSKSFIEFTPKFRKAHALIERLDNLMNKTEGKDLMKSLDLVEEITKDIENMIRDKAIEG